MTLRSLLPGLSTGRIRCPEFWAPAPSTFGPQTSYVVGQGPGLVTTADVNGDGNADLIALSDIQHLSSRAGGQRRPLGLTMAERTLLIAGTVFGVIVPISLVLFLLWSMIN